mmetsp:Transcript_25825/g.64869  ORF Transcript_25825/g.64869 Transcript_25825/m.64869 type:complete len:341 (+) Transcript_25825:1157-2179(+)
MTTPCHRSSQCVGECVRLNSVQLVEIRGFHVVDLLELLAGTNRCQEITATGTATTGRSGSRATRCTTGRRRRSTAGRRRRRSSTTGRWWRATTWRRRRTTSRRRRSTTERGHRRCGAGVRVVGERLGHGLHDKLGRVGVLQFALLDAGSSEQLAPLGWNVVDVETVVRIPADVTGVTEPSWARDLKVVGAVVFTADHRFHLAEETSGLLLLFLFDFASRFLLSTGRTRLCRCRNRRSGRTGNRSSGCCGRATTILALDHMLKELSRFTFVGKTQTGHLGVGFKAMEEGLQLLILKSIVEFLLELDLSGLDVHNANEVRVSFRTNSCSTNDSGKVPCIRVW